MDRTGRARSGAGCRRSTASPAPPAPRRAGAEPGHAANVQPPDVQPSDAAQLPSVIPLMALSTGFWAFKTLAAAHELDLFSRLAGGAGVTVAGLADALGLNPRPAEMLLTGCASLGL